MPTALTKTMNKPVSLFTNKSFEISVLSPVNKDQAKTFAEACRGMCQLGFKFKVLVKGADVWQAACLKLATDFPDLFTALESIPANQAAVLEKSQVVLFADAPSEKDLKMLQKKGLIAVLPWPSCEKYPTMMTFDAQQESGNCFLYTPSHTWDLVANMIRAFENYKFSYDWSQLKKRWKTTEI